MHDQSYTDTELFRLIAEGDETAFRLLFHRYVPELRPLIMHITKTAAVTEDIIQETFLRLWISRDKLTGIENPRSWLLRIVFYQSFTYLRRQGVHTRAMDVLASRQDAAEMNNATEEAMAYAQIVRLVAEVVRQLPPQARRIYVLSREKGLRIPEIAKELMLSPHTVKNSLVYSLKTIRKRIEQSGHFIPMVILWLLRL
jgi:RNA polymerase sigma-70 factor (ECF subfamily)